MESFMWANPPLEIRFRIFQKLVEQGWKIQLEQIDQIDNSYWWREKITGLPIPNQQSNRFGDLHLVTWSTYVYPPKSEDWIEKLNASLDSPMDAYEWLAPRLERYANEAAAFMRWDHLCHSSDYHDDHM